MSNYKSATDDAKGSPNLEAIQYLQENWGKDEIDAVVRVSRTQVTASGTSGVDVTIPVGATIINVTATATKTIGGGTAKVVELAGDNDITDAIAMAVIDVRTAAGTIDQTYRKVPAEGVNIVTNGNTDEGFVDIYYIK